MGQLLEPWSYPSAKISGVELRNPHHRWSVLRKAKTEIVGRFGSYPLYSLPTPPAKYQYLSTHAESLFHRDVSSVFESIDRRPISSPPHSGLQGYVPEVLSPTQILKLERSLPPCVRQHLQSPARCIRYPNVISLWWNCNCLLELAHQVTSALGTKEWKGEEFGIDPRSRRQGEAKKMKAAGWSKWFEHSVKKKTHIWAW